MLPSLASRAALAALAALAGCGGGGGGASTSATLALDVAFPPPVGTTDGATLTVRGTTRGPAPVTSVRVNGVDAATSDGFATFALATSLDVGATLLALDATDARGRRAELAGGCSIERVPVFLQQLASGDVDPTGAFALAVDRVGARLLECTLATGAMRIVDDADAAFGTAWSDVVAAAFDGDADHAFALDAGRGALDAVALATGKRHETSGPIVGTGPALTGALDFALVPGKQRAVVLLANEVLLVDLTTGRRSLLADATHGRGAMPRAPTGLVVDLPRNRALTATVFDDTIVAIDLGTGDRTVIAAPGDGLGPSLATPRDLCGAAGSGQAFALDFFGSIVAVDLATGRRATVGGSGATGPDLASVFGIAANDTGTRLFVSEFDGRCMAVDVATGDRAILAATDRIGDGVRIGDRGVALDRARHRLLLADLTGGLSALDLATGERTLFSDFDDARLGPAPFTVEAFGADASTAFAADSLGAVFAIDLATERRRLLSDADATGVSLRVPVAFASDRARGRLLALDQAFPFFGEPSQLVRIDLATGARTVLSSADHGVGPDFDTPTGVTVETTTGRYVVADANGLLAVDPLSGDRTRVSGGGVGGGPAFSALDDVAFDPVADRFVVTASRFPHALFFAVDPRTGERTLLADDGAAPIGSGPRLAGGCRLALDAEHGVAFLLCDFPAEAIAFDLATADRVVLGR